MYLKVNLKIKKPTLCCCFYMDSTCFFYKQHFYKQHQAKTGKNQLKAKQCCENDCHFLKLFSLSSSKNIGRYSTNLQKTNVSVLMKLYD